MFDDGAGWRFRTGNLLHFDGVLVMVGKICLCFVICSYSSELELKMDCTYCGSTNLGAAFFPGTVVSPSPAELR